MGEAAARPGAATQAAGDDDKDTAPVGTTEALPPPPTTTPLTTPPELTEPGPPALNELPPKAAMKASKSNRGRSFVYGSNTTAASQCDD